MILFLLSVASADDSAAPETQAPETKTAPPAPAIDAAAFGDHLLEAGDPFNALTWYRLALWEDPERSDAAALRFRVAYTYERGERWKAAEVAYGQLTSTAPELAAQAAYRQAVVTALSGQTDAAVFHLDGVVSWHAGTPWAERAAYASGLLYLEEYDLAAAAHRFDTVATGPLAEKASTLAASAREPLPIKSPLLAASLSTVLPGAGQLYAGHAGDATMAFVASGVLALWSYTLLADGLEDGETWKLATGGVIGGMAALTWSTNVLGAFRGAKRANTHVARRHAEGLLEQAWDPQLELHSDEVVLPPR